MPPTDPKIVPRLSSGPKIRKRSNQKGSQIWAMAFLRQMRLTLLTRRVESHLQCGSAGLLRPAAARPYQLAPRRLCRLASWCSFPCVCRTIVKVQLQIFTRIDVNTDGIRLKISSHLAKSTRESMYHGCLWLFLGPEAEPSALKLMTRLSCPE